MKILIIAALFNNFISNKILIENYQLVQDMDYQIVFPLSSSDKRVFLDCQSFFNGIHSQSLVNTEWQDDWFIVLDGNKCENIFIYAKEKLDSKKPFCLIVDLKKQIVEVNENTVECL